MCVSTNFFLPIIWFCSTTFKMTHAKCIIMVRPMVNMDSMRNILMKMWDIFIYDYDVISYEDTVPTYFDVWRFFLSDLDTQTSFRKT